MKLTRAVAAVLLQIELLNGMPFAKPIAKRQLQCQKPNLVGYWGQNSAGITYPNRADWERPLAEYCDDETYEYIYVSFLNIFPSDARSPGANKPPTLNLAYHCETTFDGYPFLLNCPEVAADIKTCQQKGKKILISIGGATGPYGFSNDAEAETFGNTFWNMFLGGSDGAFPRPFGDAILDGVDLDIEAGSSVGYATFVTTLRSKFAAANKQYFIAAAPQCVFPDAHLGPGGASAFETAWFDLITVQFYNNYCGVNNPSAFNFADWVGWAEKTSLNPDVKIYVGVPSAPSAAGSGYIDIEKLKQLATDLASKHAKQFGGIMLWEVSLAEKNLVAGGNYAAAIKSHLATLCGGDGSTDLPIFIPPFVSEVPFRTTALNTIAATTFQIATSTAGESFSTVVSPSFPTAAPSDVATLTVSPIIPTGAPSDIVNGGTCDETTQQLGTCSGTQYAQCVFGKWIIRDCAPGTVCKKQMGSGFICDWA